MPPTFDPLEPRTNKSVYAFAAAIRDQLSAILRNDFAAGQGFTSLQLWQTTTSTAGAGALYFGDPVGAMWNVRVDPLGNLNVDRFNSGVWSPGALSFEKASGGITLGANALVPTAQARLHVREAGPNTRLTHFATSGVSQDAVNVVASSDATGANPTANTFAWGSNTAGVFRVTPGTTFSAPHGLHVDRNGNVGVGAAPYLNGQSGQGLLFVGNRAAAPTGTPVGGGWLYSEAGAGKWRGTSGTVTTFGPADPHCPKCDADFMTEHFNQKYGYVSICLFCLAEHLGEQPFIVREESASFRDSRSEPSIVSNAVTRRRNHAQTLLNSEGIDEHAATTGGIERT